MVKTGDIVTIRGGGAVAYRVLGPEIERYWDLDEGIYPDDPEERETGRILVYMVGDDPRRKEAVDPDDCKPLDEDDYCHCCGQIGCAWAKGD